MRRHTPIRLAIMALALLAALLPQRSPARSQDVFHLLKDFDTSTSADARHATEAITMGGTTYFATFDGYHKSALWRTDGTADGTAVVMDFPDYLHYRAFQLIPAVDRFYFLTESFEYNTFLWVSDGTTDGTHIVLDSETGQPLYEFYVYGGYSENTSPNPFAIIGNQLFIASYFGTIWKTDGTTAGTTKIPLNTGINSLINSNGTLYIVDNTENLWTSDGTAAGTQKLSQIMTFSDWNSSDYISPHATFANKLYYLQKPDNADLTELWATDGTPAGTKKVADLNSSNPYATIAADDNGIWISTDFNDTMLWKSDGTAEGTVPITTLPASLNTDLVFLEGKLYFILSSAEGIDLWASGGTAGSTAKVATLSTTRQETQLRQVGSKLIMCGLTTVECWASDGTAAGTTAITTAGTRLKLPSAAQLGSALIAPAGGTSAKGLIWKSDGTAAGTAAITSITMGVGTLTHEAQRVNGATYFVSNSQVWKSDGTTAGTTLQSELSTKIPSGARFKELLSVNGKLIIVTSTAFLASDGTAAGTVVFKEAADSYTYAVFDHRLLISDGASSLWVSDGTATGTILLPTDGGTISDLTRNGAQMLFTTVKDGVKTLWMTNGTAAGTAALTELSSTAATRFTVQGSSIFWISPTNNHIELWTYNAQKRKPQQITDIVPAITVQYIKVFLAGKSLIMFVQSSTELEIWKSDGTDTGTTKIRSMQLSLGEEISAGDLVFFMGKDTAHGNELWRTDGTAEGTFMVKDINPGPTSSYPDFFHAVGSTIYFCAYTPTTGVELWRSDGTTAGTALYADIAPGPYSSNVRPDIGNFDTELWVQAATPQYGNEPYIVNISVGDERLYLPLITMP